MDIGGTVIKNLKTKKKLIECHTKIKHRYNTIFYFSKLSIF